MQGPSPLKNYKKVILSEVSSSDDEEQGLKVPKSPNVVYTNDYKNISCICALILFILMFIGYIALMYWVMHVDDGDDGDGRNISSPSPEDITARFVMHNHRTYRCDDGGFDCCYIYTNDHKYKFKPKYFVGRDEEGSNCPTLKEIVNKYNHYLEKYDISANCSEVPCCHVNNTKENKIRNHREEYEILEIHEELNKKKPCSSISYLMYIHVKNYPDPDQDLYILGVLLCIGGCLMSCGNNPPRRGKARGRR